MVMPHKRAPIHHVHNETAAIATQNERVRSEIAKALEVLKTPRPDTFLGRRTQDPFPGEDDDF